MKKMATSLLKRALTDSEIHYMLDNLSDDSILAKIENDSSDIIV